MAKLKVEAQSQKVGSDADSLLRLCRLDVRKGCLPDFSCGCAARCAERLSSRFFLRLCRPMCGKALPFRRASNFL